MKGSYREIKNEMYKKLTENAGLLIGEPQIIQEKIFYQNIQATFIAGAYFTTTPNYIFAVLMEVTE